MRAAFSLFERGADVLYSRPAVTRSRPRTRRTMSHHCCRHLSLSQRLGLDADHDRETLEGALEARSADGARGFHLPGDAPRWSRARPFAIEHLHAEVTLDLAARAVDGEAMILARRIDPEARELLLDAVDFELHEVTLCPPQSEARPARYRYDGRVLAVDVGEHGLGREGDLALRVRYRAIPRRGLYFVAATSPLQRPDPNAPPTEVWSQGQDEDNRCWLPLADHPGERMTTEIVANVPRGWFALSNGILVERTADAAFETFRWRQSDPHAPYLITLACGRFEEAHAKHGELPVDYYVPVGRAGDIARSLGRTPQMIALFEARLGTKYPWAKYAQVVVHDFIFGGMENTSATTLYDRVLLDERAAIDVDMDSLVAHELAHQWFGDLVTCRDWSHAWLNEGFATYCEHLWREHLGGEDEYLLGLEHDQDVYLDEDRDRYRRPIVTNVWSKPIDIFDRHLYQKGGLVLHALRRHLGDDAFFRGLAHYLSVMRGKSAETRDLHRALEDATGRSLEAFFDQWIARAGHPSLEVSSEHDAAAGLLKLTVVQTQARGDTPSSLFAVSLPLVLVTEDTSERVVLELTRARETFAVQCASPPKQVLIDPGSSVLGTVDNRLSTALLVEQLANAPSAQPRWRAARALGRRNEPRALKALTAALGRDPFWGVRAEAAVALGEQRTTEALAALLLAAAPEGVDATPEPDARVRRAIAQALGRFEGEARAADALLAWIARGDRSYLVEGELRRSLGKLRDPRALDVLARCFAEDPISWSESVRQGAVDGLAALRDVRALDLLERALGAEHAPTVRRSAVVGLGKARTVTVEEPRLLAVREAIVRALDAFDPGIRSAAARALAALRDPGGAAPLSRLAERDLDGRVRRVAREAQRDLRDRLAKGRESTAVREDLDKLQKELRELRERLAALEARKV
jgi:aminopeptidase N